MRTPSATTDDFDFTPLLAHRIRELRKKRGLSLERLARLSGVSRAMLGQIELAQSTPSVTTAWKIARGLGIALSTLLTESWSMSASVVRIDRATTPETRSLLPANLRPGFELFEVRLSTPEPQRSNVVPTGATVGLVLSAGEVEVELEGRTYDLRSGDAMWFESETHHVYRRKGEADALLYLVTSARRTEHS